jgi:hypothetical protein
LGEREFRISSTSAIGPKIERERKKERQNLREIGRDLREMRCDERKGLGSVHSEIDSQDCSKTIVSNG